jgi:hypothetical protein
MALCIFTSQETAFLVLCPAVLSAEVFGDIFHCGHVVQLKNICSLRPLRLCVNDTDGCPVTNASRSARIARGRARASPERALGERCSRLNTLLLLLEKPLRRYALQERLDEGVQQIGLIDHGGVRRCRQHGEPRRRQRLAHIAHGAAAQQPEQRD